MTAGPTTNYTLLLINIMLIDASSERVLLLEAATVLAETTKLYRSPSTVRGDIQV